MLASCFASSSPSEIVVLQPAQLALAGNAVAARTAPGRTSASTTKKNPARSRAPDQRGAEFAIDELAPANQRAAVDSLLDFLPVDPMALGDVPFVFGSHQQ